MKFQTTSFRNLLDSLTNNEIRNPTKEVKETFSTEFSNERKRNFTSAELWSIQNRKKYTFNRRSILF
jgi:hypothetical protein